MVREIRKIIAPMTKMPSSEMGTAKNAGLSVLPARPVVEVGFFAVTVAIVVVVVAIVVVKVLAGTFMKLCLSVVDPSPSWPLSFLPVAHRLPSCFTSIVWKLPRPNLATPAHVNGGAV